jgi:hypothetical protein
MAGDQRSLHSHRQSRGDRGVRVAISNLADGLTCPDLELIQQHNSRHCCTSSGCLCSADCHLSSPAVAGITFALRCNAVAGAAVCAMLQGKQSHHRCSASTMTAIVPMMAATCERTVKAPRTHFRPRGPPLLPEMQSRASFRFTHNTEAFRFFLCPRRIAFGLLRHYFPLVAS